MYEGLKEYLEKQGYTQPRMAEMLGVSVPYVNAVLLGKKPLGKKNAKKWANLFGLSENFLLTGVGFPGIDAKSGDNLPDSRKESDVNQSSLINALIAAKDETIAAMQDQLAAKEEIIQAKDELIAALRAQLAAMNYEKEIDKLGGYPRDRMASEPQVAPNR